MSQCFVKLTLHLTKQKQQQRKCVNINEEENPVQLGELSSLIYRVKELKR